VESAVANALDAKNTWLEAYFQNPIIEDIICLAISS
jgi:hypothetical protein